MYEKLTNLLPELSDSKAGEWIIDHKNDGTEEHPIQFRFVMYAGRGSTAEEVGVFTAKDSNQAKETMEDVQKYLDDQADSFQDYVPEETKRIGNAVLEQKNQYVVLCVSGDSDQAKEIIEKAFK